MYSWQYIEGHYLTQKLVRDLFLCRDEGSKTSSTYHWEVILPLLITEGDLLQ